MRNYAALAVCICLFSILLQGCSDSPEKYAKTGIFFDTAITITVYGTNAEENLTQCFSICEDMEDTFSRTKKGSELYEINHRNTQSVTVSDDMATVISEGLRFWKLSDGLFDITIAPVTELWDFKSDDPSVPSQGDVEAALQYVDASSVHLSGHTLQFDNGHTQLELGALAKGYAADRIKSYLKMEGIQSALINLGGNVLALGEKPDGSAWNVGIQKPFADAGEMIDTVSVDDGSVVSSGTYERCFTVDGIRYHHILDPRTGYPFDSDLSQVTILSDASLTGDSLSTVCFLLGEDQAENLLASLDPSIRAIFVYTDGTVVKYG